MKKYSKKQHRAAYKITNLFRAAKPRKRFLKTKRRRSWAQADFYSNEKYRNSSLMRAQPAPRHSRTALGYSPAPRHITRAMRVQMYRRRAAADYKHFERTGKRRNIYRGGAFFQ